MTTATEQFIRNIICTSGGHSTLGALFARGARRNPIRALSDQGVLHLHADGRVEYLGDPSALVYEYRGTWWWRHTCGTREDHPTKSGAVAARDRHLAACTREKHTR